MQHRSSPTANFTAGAPGWEAVADYALEWANRHTSAPARTE